MKRPLLGIFPHIRISYVCDRKACKVYILTCFRFNFRKNSSNCKILASVAFQIPLQNVHPCTNESGLVHRPPSMYFVIPEPKVAHSGRYACSYMFCLFKKPVGKKCQELVGCKTCSLPSLENYIKICLQVTLPYVETVWGSPSLHF